MSGKLAKVVDTPPQSARIVTKHIVDALVGGAANTIQVMVVAISGRTVTLHCRADPSTANTYEFTLVFGTSPRITQMTFWARPRSELSRLILNFVTADCFRELVIKPAGMHVNRRHISEHKTIDHYTREVRPIVIYATSLLEKKKPWPKLSSKKLPTPERCAELAKIGDMLVRKNSRIVATKDFPSIINLMPFLEKVCAQHMLLQISSWRDTLDDLCTHPNYIRLHMSTLAPPSKKRKSSTTVTLPKRRKK